MTHFDTKGIPWGCLGGTLGLPRGAAVTLLKLDGSCIPDSEQKCLMYRACAQNQAIQNSSLGRHGVLLRLPCLQALGIGLRELNNLHQIIVQCTRYHVTCSMYHVPCTMYLVQCTVYLPPCTVYYHIIIF